MPYQKLIIDSGAGGQRLDQFLSATGFWPSRTFIQKVIAAGGVRYKGKVLRPSFRLEPGYEIEVLWDEPEPLTVEPEAIPLEILYEDHDLVVVNKPRGMVVHPAAGNYHGTLVNALLEHCRDLSGIGGKIRPGIIHRLDKDTSGVLVVAKNDLSHLALAGQLKARTMKRLYKALVHGNPPENGRIAAPIGRHPSLRKQMAVVATGKPAVTHYTVLEFLGSYALVELKLESGRTHQIRVHLSHIGYPVVGDPVYGRQREKVPIQGQALHAAVLGFTHPRSGEYLEFTSAIPEVMQQAIEWCRKQS